MALACLANKDEDPVPIASSLKPSVRNLRGHIGQWVIRIIITCSSHSTHYCAYLCTGMPSTLMECKKRMEDSGAFLPRHLQFRWRAFENNPFSDQFSILLIRRSCPRRSSFHLTWKPAGNTSKMLRNLMAPSEVPLLSQVIDSLCLQNGQIKCSQSLNLIGWWIMWSWQPIIFPQLCPYPHWRPKLLSTSEEFLAAYILRSSVSWNASSLSDEYLIFRTVAPTFRVAYELEDAVFSQQKFRARMEVARGSKLLNALEDYSAQNPTVLK